MTRGYDFYGAEVSYFSGKVRAYLRYKRIPFSEITPTRDIYRDVILARVGWPVIPVVVTPEDETWQDSSEIIDNSRRREAETRGAAHRSLCGRVAEAACHALPLDKESRLRDR